jgi:hypothetical protein
MTDAKEPLVQYGYRLSVRDDSAQRDAERAVIEAAKALRDSATNRQLVVAIDRLEDAVDALRALEGDA